MKLPEFSVAISKNANVIDVININDEDVKKVVKYINETKQDAINQSQEMQIFKIEELEKLVDDTVDFICCFLKTVKSSKSGL